MKNALSSSGSSATAAEKLVQQVYSDHVIQIWLSRKSEARALIDPKYAGVHDGIR